MIRRLAARVLSSYIYYTPSHPGRGVLMGVVNRLVPQGFPSEVAPGVRFYIRLNSGEDYAYWKGAYETQGELRCFRTLLAPGMTVFDVGANLGLYSLAAGRDVGPGGRVYGFEPMPPVFARLGEHIALNGATNVTAVPLAASDRAGTAAFFPDESGHGTGAGSLVRPHGKSKIQVETITLDEFKRRNGIGKVSVVKIDAEGAEPMVLDGMQGILRDDRPAMLVEHNDGALAGQGSSARGLFERIVGYGYRAFYLKGGEMIPVTELQPPLYNATAEACSNYIFKPL